MCAVGVVPTRVYPQSGRISALAGRQGRLRACTRGLPARRLAAMTM
ncbi:replication protein RepA4 [Salmonella enterica subsp. enterica]|nr:replication protein RepA4 [Salmonella enterica subsp. enterica]